MTDNHIQSKVRVCTYSLLSSFARVASHLEKRKAQTCPTNLRLKSESMRQEKSRQEKFVFAACSALKQKTKTSRSGTTPTTYMYIQAEQFTRVFRKYFPARDIKKTTSPASSREEN